MSDGIRALRAPGNIWNQDVAMNLSLEPQLAGYVGSVDRDVDGSSRPDYCCACNLDDNPPDPTYPKCKARFAAMGCGQNLTPLDAASCAKGYKQQLKSRPRRNGIVLMHDGLEASVGSSYALNLTTAFVQKVRSDPDLANVRFEPLDTLGGVTGSRSFSTPTLWTPSFADTGGWNTAASYYGSIRLTNIDGTGRSDICVRTASGIYCDLSANGGFSPIGFWVASGVTGFQDPNWKPDPERRAELTVNYQKTLVLHAWIGGFPLLVQGFGRIPCRIHQPFAAR
jgi:hypothetical protein